MDLSPTFIIVSGSLGQQFIPNIHDMTHIKFIYIFCQNLQKHNEWAKIWNKTDGRIFNSIEPLVERVRRDIVGATLNRASADSPISIEGRSVIDTHRIVPEFKWMRLLGDTLARFMPTERSRQDMVNALLDDFDANASNEKFVDDLAKLYESKDALTWYSKAGPLFRMLNRAMRNERMDIIYKYRQLIRDISLAIQHHHCTQNKYYEEVTMGSPYRVFRGQNMSMENIRALQQSNDKVVSFNGFLSTSHDSSVAKTFLQSRESGFEPVLFDIKIDRSPETTAFADIKDFSNIKSENEVLFDLNALFRVTSIVEKEAEILEEVKTNQELVQVNTVLTVPAHWYVELELCPKNCEVGQHYWDIEHGGQSRLEEHDSQLFGKLLIEMGRLREAQSFYEALLAEATDNDDGSLQADCLTGLSRVALDNGDYSMALQRAHQSLALRRTLGISLKSILTELGGIHHELGQYLNSLNYYQQSLDLCADEQYTDQARLLDDMAMTFHRMGRYEEAQVHCDKALSLYSTALGKDQPHPSIATVHSHLGAIFMAQSSKFDEALREYRIALNLYVQTLPANHPCLGRTHSSIAYTLKAQAHFDEALHECKLGLDIIKRALSSNHPYVAMIYNIIGSIYADQGLYEQALDLHEKALLIFENTLTSYHWDLARTYDFIGTVHTHIGRLNEACKSYERAIEIAKKNTPDHPDLAISYNNLAGALSDLEKHDLAKEYYEKALVIQQKSLSPDHTAIAMCNMNLGLTLAATGSVDEALTHYRVAQAIYEHTYGSNNSMHPTLGSLYHNLGQAYHIKLDIDQAKRYYLRCLDLRRRSLPSNHKDIGQSLYAVGTIYHYQKDFVIARDYFEQALEIYKTTLIEENPLVLEVRYALSILPPPNEPTSQLNDG